MNSLNPLLPSNQLSLDSSKLTPKEEVQGVDRNSTRQKYQKYLGFKLILEVLEILSPPLTLVCPGGLLQAINTSCPRLRLEPSSRSVLAFQLCNQEFSNSTYINLLPFASPSKIMYIYFELSAVHY